MTNSLSKHIALAGLTLSLLTTAALAKPVGPNDKAASSVTSGEKTWVIKHLQGGAEEVRLGQLAATKGTNPKVKEFGKHMVGDHSKAGTELKMLADKKGIKIPAKDSKSDKDFDKLNKLSGADFDKQYVDMMVADHKADVAAFQKEAEKGSDPNLKAWAGKTLPTLQSHLKMIQEIQSSMGKK